MDLVSPRFALLRRSLFLARPPVRRPTLRWDLEKVLGFLRLPAFGSPTTSVSLLLERSLFLTALATGNRVSEIAALCRDGISDLADGSLSIPVRQGFLYKNQSARRTPPPVVLRPLPGDALCPVTALRAYLRASSSPAGALFVHPRSLSPLSRGHISVRVCRLIRQADPAGVPQMHDLRRAAASIAWTRGVPADQIVQRAFWSSSSVFIRRYLTTCPAPPCVALQST